MSYAFLQDSQTINTFAGAGALPAQIDLGQLVRGKPLRHWLIQRGPCRISKVSEKDAKNQQCKQDVPALR